MRPYTAEQDVEGKNVWYILDPEGIFICYVYSQDEMEALLSHLNRG